MIRERPGKRHLQRAEDGLGKVEWEIRNGEARQAFILPPPEVYAGFAFSCRREVSIIRRPIGGNFGGRWGRLGSIAMDRRWLLVLGAAVALVAAGCRSLAMPTVARPGTAQYQQSVAERFDPYPENEPAPTVVGGRPLEYEKPPPEVARARWLP